MPALSIAVPACWSTKLNMPDRLLPKAVIAAMAETAIMAAISPYAMAVAPDSSRVKRLSLSQTAAMVLSQRLQEIAERRDQRFVGRRHRIVPQRLRPHPLERGVLARLGHALPLSADVKWHQKMKVFVRVTRKTERCETGRPGLDIELFAQFADQRRLWTFARLDLAA